MLAQTADDVREALELLAGDVAFEWKMDGARIQLHKRGSLVRIFTRNLNDVTAAIPEIAAAASALSEDQLVLDGEAIAFAPSGRPTRVSDDDAAVWPQVGRGATTERIGP
jgi:DNA ligase-1